MMGCVTFLGVLAAANPPAVSQADFWWQKVIEARVEGPTIPAPMFLPNGDIVVVSANEGGRFLISYFNPEGGEKKSLVQDGELGAAAVDRGGRLMVACRDASGMRIARYSASGELESESRAPGMVLPAGLIIERSGDLFVGGSTNGAGLGYVGRFDSAGKLAWGGTRGKAEADAWRPASMAVFQTGNIVVAGDARRPDGVPVVRVVKYSSDGKELMTVDLPGDGTAVAVGVDPDSNIIVLTRPVAGGAVVWCLEGARGLVRWKNERMATPEIRPVALQVDPRKYINVLIDNTEEAKTRAYAVRFSLGGAALLNYRPSDDPNRGSSLALDEYGEVYLVITGGGEKTGAAWVFRTANNLNNRYAIRYHFPHAYEAKHIAVRNSDGSGLVLGLAGDPAGPRKPILLKFRQAPVAKYETYSVPAGQVFESPFSVLQNDQYAEGAAMQLTVQPKNGSLEFRKDGTFRYTPSAGFKGKDTFRYQLSRGQLFWYAAIVTLDVQ